MNTDYLSQNVKTIILQEFSIHIDSCVCIACYPEGRKTLRLLSIVCIDCNSPEKEVHTHLAGPMALLLTRAAVTVFPSVSKRNALV